ncbi:MAG: hypothetical protein ACYCXY_10690 [Acidimicrobiales bacterium]
MAISSAIVVIGTLFGGGFAPAIASGLTNASRTSGHIKFPSAWVATGSGSVHYSWHGSGTGACASGSQDVSWRTIQAGTSFFSSTGFPAWAFQVHAVVNGKPVAAKVLFVWQPDRPFLGDAGTNILLALLAGSCHGGPGAVSGAATTSAMMGWAKGAPPSTRMQCKRQTSPTTTLPNGAKPKWICTIRTGSSLTFTGGRSRTGSFDAFSGHWSLTIKQGRAKIPPPSPKPTTKGSNLAFGGAIAGQLDNPGVCISAGGALMLNFGGIVGGKHVGLSIRIVGYTEPGSFTMAAQSATRVALFAGAFGAMYGNGSVTVSADGKSGSVHLHFQGGIGSETISGHFGCAA